MNRTGILLINLGTPLSPATGDVRDYLNEFLMDGRVIDIHPLKRAALVKGIIVPFRAPKSAKLYRSIWDRRMGSPILLYSNLQRHLLKMSLAKQYQVEVAMRYGYPSISAALDNLKGVNKIKIIPLFPQYASATTGSVIQKVMEILSHCPTIPNLEFVNSFHDHPLFIEAFAKRGRQYPMENYDHVLFSFHGLPQSHLIKSDNTHQHCLKVSDCCLTLTERNKFCYGAQCHDTARLIADKFNISPDSYSICFQSRLGNKPWMQPYTSDVIEQLAKAGKKRILVFCPAFVADCLETIHEIGVEYRELFINAGGEDLQLVESLNNSPLFIEMLQDLAIGCAIRPC